MEEDMEEFSKTEPDPPGLEASETPQGGVIQKALDREPREGKMSVRRWMPAMIGLIFMVGTAILLTKGATTISGMGRESGHHQEDPRALRKFAVPKPRSIQMNAFVIPFLKSKKFTYASLNISFSLRNEEIWAEMINKRTWLRGVIFDRLSQEINGSEEIPSLEELKASIKEEINRALTSGKINEAYVTDFLII
jgi:flagellar basal body-associated protein FliL